MNARYDLHDSARDAGLSGQGEASAQPPATPPPPLARHPSYDKGRAPESAITAEEYADLMAHRRRPLTDGPIRRRQEMGRTSPEISTSWFGVHVEITDDTAAIKQAHK